MLKNKSIIVIADLPKEQQEPFMKWLDNQSLPCDDDDTETDILKYAWAWDYKIWLYYWSKGKIAPILD